jgi:hypothetical protein
VNKPREAGDTPLQTSAHAFVFSLLAGALDVEFAIYASTSAASEQLVHNLLGCFRWCYICCSHEASVVFVCEGFSCSFTFSMLTSQST